MASRNELIHAEVSLALFVKDIRGAALRVNQRQAFPVGIAAALRDLFTVELRYKADIVHQLVHVFEEIGINSLQNIFLFRPAVFHFGKVCFVDVPLAVAFAGNELAFDLETGDYFLKSYAIKTPLFCFFFIIT